MNLARRADVVTLLTLVATGAWLASLVVRIVQPAWPGSAGIDAVMVLIVGYWFTGTSLRRGGS